MVICDANVVAGREKPASARAIPQEKERRWPQLVSDGSSALGTGFRDSGNGGANSATGRATRQRVLDRRHDLIAVCRRRDVLERNRKAGDIAVGCGGRGPERDGSDRGSDGGCDPEGYHLSPPLPLGRRRPRPLWYAHRRSNSDPRSYASLGELSATPLSLRENPPPRRTACRASPPLP